MLNGRFLLPVLFMSGVAACLPATEISSADRTQRAEATAVAAKLDRYLQSQVAKGFAGVALVESSDGLLLHDSFGMTDDSDRARCFWIASVSKMFTAATAVSLNERGLLDLHASIADYLDGVPDDKRPITMHHLLTHTSGLVDSYVAEGITLQDRAIAAILRTRLEHRPGTEYLYSSNGYSLAALMIEKISGRPFEEAVRQAILAPAGLRDTGFWGHPVESCALVPFETRRRISDAKRVPNYGFRGPTGMRSTAADLHRWYKALTGDKLLSAASREAIFTPHVEKAPHVAYGYGWNIVETERDTRMLAHTGQDDLIRHCSYLYAFPDEGVLVILLADAEPEIANETLKGMIGILFPTD